MRKQMNVHAFKLDRLRIPPMATFRGYEMEKADPETKLKMEALYAIGESTSDEKAFQALKEVALDRKQPLLLRNAALETLADFKKFDILSIYVDLARTDTSEKIQSAALEYIAEGSKDKNKSVEVLTNLFNTTPKHRSGQLQTVLYVIADIGNDKAVDFLSTVARTHEDYELRSDAVYYLGTIGGEKARAALYQILRSK
ncbi:MAG: HEAT repeat domain-containing protein [Bacteroidota bacterium]